MHTRFERVEVEIIDIGMSMITTTTMLMMMLLRYLDRQ